MRATVGLGSWSRYRRSEPVWSFGAASPVFSYPPRHLGGDNRGSVRGRCAERSTPVPCASSVGCAGSGEN